MDQRQKDKYEFLGLRIAYYRKLRQLTQEQLSEAVGIESTYVSKIEQGKVGVSLDVVFHISDVLHIPVYKFFQFEEE